MKPNGPAIEGGCVTRHQHRPLSYFFSQKMVTVQGGYGTPALAEGGAFLLSRCKFARLVVFRGIRLFEY